MKPFTPVDDATASVTATTSGADRTAIKQQPTGAHQLRLYNAGTGTIFWAAGGATVTAALTDVPLPGGAIEVVTLANAAAAPLTHLAAVTQTGAAVLYATTGEGF